MSTIKVVKRVHPMWQQSMEASLFIPPLGGMPLSILGQYQYIYSNSAGKKMSLIELNLMPNELDDKRWEVCTGDKGICRFKTKQEADKFIREKLGDKK